MIVLLISVRDEAQFIQANIQHHLNIGFDRIVFTEICSSDGTREILREYDGDPRFHITYLDDQDIRKYPWKRKMIEIAKERFNATWVTTLDADEFLLPKSGHLKKEIQHRSGNAIRINRYNAVFTEEADFRDFYQVGSLEEAPLMVKTDPDTRTRIQAGEHYPWIMGPIGPKVIAPADPIIDFTRGGHDVTNSDGQMIDSIPSENMILAHFPFTTFKRFLNKISNITALEANLRDWNKNHPLAGWQWYRWIDILKQGKAALKEEFDLQVLSAEHMSQMRQCGDILNPREVFEILAHEPPEKR